MNEQTVPVIDRALVLTESQLALLRKWQCPYCARPMAQITEEVDIGVGVQTYVTGVQCENAECAKDEPGPPEFGVCGGCAVPIVSGIEHYAWCQS